MKTLLTILAKLAIAFGGVMVFCVLAAWLVSPDLDAELPNLSADALARLGEQRRLEAGSDSPPTLHVAVDYAEGATASWYPKGEAPLLAELVAEGKLPPVAERVGPEPVVMRGHDGIGKYGGTMVRAGTGAVMNFRLSYASLLRFSPRGFPIVPHIAKSYTVSEDKRVYTFTLRKGLRWSDGHLLTVDDIMYWWESEQLDPAVSVGPPSWMLINGRRPDVKKLDDHRVRITFPEPYARFLYWIAGPRGRALVGSPRHYLEQFHPTRGDRSVIDDWKETLGLHNDKAVYSRAKDITNPEHPRLWQWVYRTYKTTPPQVFVRNPYYYAVDTEGNQLPYVDRVIFNDIPPRMLPVAASNGEITMQRRNIRFDDYALLMSQQEVGGYTVRHWLGSRSWWTLFPNQVGPTLTDVGESPWKRKLLSDRRFRQALSLAINREQIVKAFYYGQTDPANDVAGPSSPFHHPGAYTAFTEYDPDRANRLLDDLGLGRRDTEGYRTYPDGSRMLFRIAYTSWTGLGPGHFVVDDWGAVGVRAILKEQARTLFATQQAAGLHDFQVFEGEGEFLPLLDSLHTRATPAYHKWFERGGLYSNPKATPEYGCVPPPEGHPLRRAMEISCELESAVDMAAQKAILDRVNDIFAENIWNVNICSSPPILAVVKNGLRNVPEKLVATYMFQTPGNAGPALFYFDEPTMDRQTVEQTKAAIINPTLPPRLARDTESKTGAARLSGILARWVFISVVLLLPSLLIAKRPQFLWRLILMIPTLLFMSMLVFTVIQLPPGDFVTAKIQSMEASGDDVNPQDIRDLREMFYLDDSMPVRYLRWMGFTWFLTFADEDKGLLQGNLGRSMETLLPVADMVGDRVLLTVAISLGTILLTWAIALPIGIYSAVKQYTIGDYIFTVVGFIGMCVPGFLLAIILMYVSQVVFGVPISGLFSARYAAQAGWSWGKVIDLLQHIWIPIVVLGVGGTAGMIRVMRANLLDELKKPYVVTARAKGVRPMRLLLKYPVRLALNPFVSGIGGIFPNLISGGAIVAIVLSLPTVSPLMLEALQNEDMYLAGSLLMILSVLAVVGTLVSDLLLLSLDPRIRLEGGAR
ncbi:MAG: ABC transporter substrate-binding protein [Lentisphaeria bacterium]|nr:ABC transporter substrate-binding protein [Lentisphaeria bacterium]